jgi:outer membrane protein assembly factor BamB
LKSRLLSLSFAPLLLAACSGQTAPAASTPTPAGTGPSPKWTFQTGAAIWGSAAVRDGVVYIGSNDHRLYAVDAKTGDERWELATQGEVRSQPTFAGDAAIFSSDDGYLYAADARTGQQLWRADIHNVHQRVPLNDPNMGGSYDFDFLTSSPVVAAGAVFVGSADGALYALDAASGSVSWAFQTGDRIRATPAIGEGVVYIGSWDGYLYALDAATGALVWKTLLGVDGSPRYLTLPIQSTAYVAGGVVYCASRKAATFALDAATGTVLWETSNGSGNWLESSPVARGKYVYIGSSLASNLNIYDATSGEERSHFSLAVAAWSTPLVTDGVAFIGSEGNPNGVDLGGGMWAVDIGPSGGLAEPRWFYPVSGSQEPAGYNGVNSSPQLADGVLYFGGLDGRLYALAV